MSPLPPSRGSWGRGGEGGLIRYSLQRGVLCGHPEFVGCTPDLRWSAVRSSTAGVHRGPPKQRLRQGAGNAPQSTSREAWRGLEQIKGAAGGETLGLAPFGAALGGYTRAWTGSSSIRSTSQEFVMCRVFPGPGYARAPGIPVTRVTREVNKNVFKLSGLVVVGRTRPPNYLGPLRELHAR